MVDVIIGELEPAVISVLEVRAAANGRTLEEQIRHIITEAAKPTPAERVAIADEIRKMSPPVTDVDFEALIRADRDRN